VDAAESPDGEGRIQSCGEPFARDVANVEANIAVRENEIVKVVAAHFGNRLKFVGDQHAICMERLGGEHCPLDDAGFLKFLFTQFFDGKKVL
jgi:hypothetical protein